MPQAEMSHRGMPFFCVSVARLRILKAPEPHLFFLNRCVFIDANISSCRTAYKYFPTDTIKGRCQKSASEAYGIRIAEFGPCSIGSAGNAENEQMAWGVKRFQEGSSERTGPQSLQQSLLLMKTPDYHALNTFPFPYFTNISTFYSSDTP